MAGQIAGGQSLKAPQQGDAAALKDLQKLRRLLKTRVNDPDISARDLATCSAELRKVNATISIVQGSQSKGGIAEEDLASRAHSVRERLVKTKAERDRLKDGGAAVPELPQDGVSESDGTAANRPIEDASQDPPRGVNE